jgi:DNA-binding MltR family transcriptional regulator
MSRKLKLRHYSTIALTPEQSAKLRKLLLEYKQHSITIAILGAVMVEHELDTLLRRRFKRKDDNTWDELVSDRGPLSSFYAKIVAGYAFAIYDKNVRHDLDIIRTIRNTFAHSKKLIEFDDDLIVAELVKAHFLNKRLKRSLRRANVVEAGKAAYISICQSVALKLLQRRVRATLASRKRMERKLRQSPFANALAYGRSTSLAVSRIGGLGSFLLSSPPGHTARLSPEAQLGLLSALFQEPPKSGDSGDK